MDWDTLGWSRNQQTRTGPGVDEIYIAYAVISSKYFNSATCTSAKWPECIQVGVNYSGSDLSGSPFIVGSGDNAACANLCQQRQTPNDMCMRWLLQSSTSYCYLKAPANIPSSSEPLVLGSGTRHTCFNDWSETGKL
jgi:hypothetical protein